MRISDWSSDVCSSDLGANEERHGGGRERCRKMSSIRDRLSNHTDVGSEESSPAIASALSPSGSHAEIPCSTRSPFIRQAAPMLRVRQSPRLANMARVQRACGNRESRENEAERKG